MVQAIRRGADLLPELGRRPALLARCVQHARRAHIAFAVFLAAVFLLPPLLDQILPELYPPIETRQKVLGFIPHWRSLPDPRLESRRHQILFLAWGGGIGSTVALLLALFWQPDHDLSLKLEQVWLPLAVLLVLRSLWHIFMIGDDVVIPVVDLLLLLLCAEALRSLDAHNDARLYALSFALLLASTAYRPGLLFAVAFVSYVALATVTLMVGHARREAEANGVMNARLGSRFLLAMTGLSVVCLVGSAVVFLTFPRVSQAWVGRGETQTRSIVGFSDQVSLGQHGSRIFPNPQIVLRVEFPDGPPPSPQNLYWRGRSYDRFDGVRWSRSPRLTPSLGLDRWYEGWGPDRLNYRVYAIPLDVKVLFTLHPALTVRATEPRIQPLFDNSGDHIYWGSGSPVYDVVSVTARPDPERLRSARRGSPTLYAVAAPPPEGARPRSAPDPGPHQQLRSGRGNRAVPTDRVRLHPRSAAVGARSHPRLLPLRPQSRPL